MSSRGDSWPQIRFRGQYNYSRFQTTPGNRDRVSSLDDMVYTAESSGDAFWSFNPTTLVINDTIHACVARNRLRLTRPDGKDYSTKIVRAIRETQSSSPQD